MTHGGNMELIAALFSSRYSTHRCLHVYQKVEREILRAFNKITLFSAPVIASPRSILSLLIYSNSILSYFLTSYVHVSKRQISNSDATVNAGGEESPGLRQQDYRPHGTCSLLS
jgi:hypothetical protein